MAVTTGQKPGLLQLLSVNSTAVRYCYAELTEVRQTAVENRNLSFE